MIELNNIFNCLLAYEGLPVVLYVTIKDIKQKFHNMF